MWPGNWGAQVFTEPVDTGIPIHSRLPGKRIIPTDGITFPSHEAALAAALAEVGLAGPAMKLSPTTRASLAEAWDEMVADAIRCGVTTDARLHPNPYRKAGGSR